jgi:hypothetical protein
MHTGCDPLLQVPSAQSLTGEAHFDHSKRSQPLYAETGHSIGHSPADENCGACAVAPSTLHATIGKSSAEDIEFVIRFWRDGLRPEEIQAKHPKLPLSKVYGLIAVHLALTEGCK